MDETVIKSGLISSIGLMDGWMSGWLDVCKQESSFIKQAQANSQLYKVTCTGCAPVHGSHRHLVSL